MDGDVQNVEGATTVTPPEVGIADLVKEIEGMKKSISAFQSEKDVAIQTSRQSKDELAETRRQLKAAQSTLKNLRGKYGEDSEFMQAIEGEESRSRLSIYEQREAEEKAKREAERTHSEFVGAVGEILQDMGVDPKNPRLAQAIAGATSYADWTRRIIKEALRITKGEETPSGSFKDELKAEIAKIRKDLGLDIGTDITPTGAGKKWTKARIAALSPEEYAKNRDEIMASYQKGEIK